MMPVVNHSFTTEVTFYEHNITSRMISNNNSKIWNVSAKNLEFFDMPLENRNTVGDDHERRSSTPNHGKHYAKVCIVLVGDVATVVVNTKPAVRRVIKNLIQNSFVALKDIRAQAVVDSCAVQPFDEDVLDGINAQHKESQ